MGTRGPAPTPTPILEARGSWLAKTRQAEPQLTVKAPPCPAWLSAEAKAEWRRQVRHLKTLGVLAEADRALLVLYCEAWSEYVLAEAWVQKHGRTTVTEAGNVMLHPMCALRNRAAEQVVKIAAQFGFSPSARARLKTVAAPETQADAKDRFFKIDTDN